MVRRSTTDFRILRNIKFIKIAVFWIFQNKLIVREKCALVLTHPVRTVSAHKSWVAGSALNKTTLITGGVGGAGAGPPSCKMFALVMQISNN